MNRVYRLVFNRALRVWQVASELVRAPGGSTGASAPRAHHATIAPLRFAMLCALGLVSLVDAAQAQSAGRIVGAPAAPGNERPTVMTAPNGVPLVNITTPSAAGVSRNRYSQFDVGREGAILNNARTQTQTQLGGWVQGNPWLATGSAKVILNEVNGPTSRLNGYLEVAGQRAEVIIANSAGIQVDGGGFLNASRVTLTTGTPILSGGALEGYRVSGGAIQIGGAGLDTSRADYTDLITRSLQVNAGIWANQLQATLGNNVVSADHRSVATQAADGQAPTFALDVGALGGMFANKIWLVGNEHGVGVRNAGNLGAQAGELVVTVDGRLENTGALQSQQDTQIAASGGIANSGTLSAARELRVGTAADLDNRGGTLDAQRLQIDAASLRNQGGTLTQTGMQALEVTAGSASNRTGGSIGALATAPSRDGGSPAPGGDNTGTDTNNNAGTGTDGGRSPTPTPGGQSPVATAPLATGTLHIAGLLDNDGGRIGNGGAVRLAAAAGLDNSAGQLGVAALQVRGDLRNSAGTLEVQGDADLHLGALVNDQGRFSVANALDLQAQSLSNRAGDLRHGGSAASTWQVAGLLDNQGGVLTSNAAALQLQAQTVVNADGRIVHTGTQGLTLAVQTWSGAGGSIVTPGALTWQAGSIDHRNATLTTSQLVVQAATLDNRGGTLVSSGTQAASVHVDAALDNGAGGTIASNGALDLRAATLGNAGGQIQQAGPGLLQIAAQAIDGNGGRLLSNGGLTLTGGRIDLTGGTTAAQQVQIQAETLTTAGGSVSSLGDQALQLTVRQGLDNHAGHLASNAGLAIAAGALSNQGGAIAAAGTTDATVTVAGRLDNSGGSISGNGRVAVDADTLINQHGSVLAANGAPLQLHAASLLDNSAGGRLASGGEFAVQAGTLDNRGGAIEHGGNGTLAVSADTLQGAGGSLLSLGSLQLRGGVLDLGTGSTTQADRIDIAAASLRTAGGHLSATGSGPLQVHLSDTLDNRAGSIASNGALDLQAATLLNSDGTLSGAGSADGRITVSGQLDNTRGRIAANGATLQIAADQLINAQGTLSHAGSAGLVIDSHRVDGSQGTIVTSGMLSLTAATVDHRGATIGADRIALDVQQLDNSGGRIVASGTGASSLQADTLDNAGGIVASAGDLTVVSTLLDNTQGTLQHSGNGQLHLTAQTLLGDAGKLLSNGALTLHGQTTDLRNATTSAAALSIDTGDLTTAGGTLVATGSQLLTLTARGTLDNSGGSIGGNGVIALSAQTLRNAQGTLQVAGTGASTVDVAQALQNQQGKLLLGGSGRIAAASIDNQGGTLSAAGTALQVQVAGLLDNHAAGTVSSAGQLSVGSGSLDNSAGTLVAGTDLNVTTTAAIGNDAGALQAGGGVQLQSAGLSNRAGSVIGGQVVVDTGGQTLDNSAGTIGSKLGTLQIRSGTLANAGGRLQSQSDLTLQSNGAAIVNSNSGSTGGILAGAALQIDGGTLDNRNGAIVAQGQARLGLASVDNSSAGVLSAAGNFTLTAATLDNTSGRVQGGQNLTLQLSGALANQAGLVTTRNLLTLNAATVDNRNTRANALQGLQAGQLQVQAQALDNRQGQVISDGAGTVQLSAALDNSGGQISSGSSLDMRADAVTNTAGLLRSGGNQRLDARALSGDGQLQSQGDLSLTLREGLTNTGELSANGTLSIHTDGDLANQGVLRAGNLEVAARTIDNAANGQITSQGLTHLVSNGQLLNRGLIDGGVTHLQAATLDNLGTGRIYGDQVAIAAGSVLNHAETVGGATRVGTIAARQRLDLGVGQLTNSDRGLIYSDGDAAIGGALDGNRHATGAAGQVDNLGSTIDVAGNLDLQAGGVNNIRQNVVVTQTTTTLAPVRLDQPSWRNNGKNGNAPLRTTSLYSAYEIYYLNPQDIVEDTPYITPDGYQVRRAVIRVNPQTSAYFFARGALYRATGERSRLDPRTGTLTLYYFTRDDNNTNPDQVSSGASDPFAGMTTDEAGAPAFHYESDTLRYSNAYGTCTTNCVRLIAQYAYTDPDHILVNPQGTGPLKLEYNEHYRTATQTVVEDVLQPGAGPDAVIRAGGSMRIGANALRNEYASIAAGGNLAIVGLGGNPNANVTNLAYTLYRTHSFSNVTTAYNGTTRSWSNPSISEQVGQVGGSIVSGGTLTIDVGDLSNLNQGRDAPNVRDGAAMANLNVRGAQAGPTGASASVRGPISVASQGVGRITTTVAQADSGNASNNVGSIGSAATTSGPRVVNAAGGSPDRIVMGTPDTRAPTGSLFTLRPASGHYLVETDPQFTDYRSWLGSDYLLRQMGYSADALQKRLGDGYYEQKLVREQIGQLTGRRFLDGYKDDEAQYQALLDAGATIGKAWNLRPGIALSEAQMAQLTSDIVWLVEQTVTLPDGSTTTALVPQVYLRLRPGDLDSGGALLAGANVDAHASGTLTNTGTIAGRQLVSLDAGRIEHLGGSISGNQVALTSASDIDIHGASVSAVDALSVRAAGNIDVASTVETLQGGGHQEAITRVAGLYVTGANGSGVLSVVGGGDVTLQAAQVRNAGSDGVTQLVAGHDLTLGAQTLTHSTDATHDARNYQRSSETTHAVSSVQGAGEVVLAAGHDMTLQAAQIGAGKTLALQAGHDLDSQAVVDSRTQSNSSVSKRHSLVTSNDDEHVQGTQLGAGGDIVMRAGNDLTLASTAVASQNGGIALAAGHDVALTATQEQHDSVVDEQTRKHHFLSNKTTTTHDESHDSLAVTSSLSGDTVHIAAGNDVLSQGAQIVGTGDVVLAAGNNLTLETAQNTHSEEHDKQVKKSGLFSSGGASFTIGASKQTNTLATTQVSHTGSTVGSIDGAVTLTAGNALAISGSDVLSKTGTAIVGKDVTIAAVEDTVDTVETSKQHSAGINVGLTGAVVQAAEAAYGMTRHGSQVSDDRLKALYAVKAAYAAKDSVDAYQAAAAQGGSMGGVSVRIGIGASSASSK
ncbi:filamentous hemagglutinin N-terminal domain-containing protein, partial [Xanthomonas oryzae]